MRRSIGKCRPYPALLPEHLEPQRQDGAEPGSVRGVVGEVVASLGVEQHGQAVAVEHEPWHEASQHLARKRDLIHRLRMRSDWRVVPATKHRGRKSLGDALAQA